MRKLLLVEDSDDDAFFFDRALKNTAIDVPLIRLSDGGAAVECLKRLAAESMDLRASHLMFLDLKLPVLSGFEVLRWIRERKLLLEVIVLSGSDLDSDRATARELGAADYLVKPVSSAELKRRLIAQRERPNTRPAGEAA